MTPNEYQNEAIRERQAPGEAGMTRSKKKTWLWRLAIAGALFLVFLAILAVAVVTLLGQMGGEPLHLALETLRKDATVTQRLGPPIKLASWFPRGSVSVQGDQGEANLTFRIQGSRGKAVVNVIARRIAGKWGLTSLEVTYPDGTRHRVDVSRDGDSELDAPRWIPSAGTAQGTTGPEQRAPPDSTPPAQQQSEELSAPPSVEIKIPEPSLPQ